MKKFAKSFLLAAAALMLFAGCSNLGDATVSGEDGKAVITIGVDGITNSASRNASRTINPTPIPQTYSFGKITLKGESENGNSFAETELTFDANGKATYELTYDVWYLTLTGYSNDTPQKAILQGRKRVDMKNGAPASNEAITFTLSAEGVEGKGSVNISGTFTEDVATSPLAVSYTAALYDLNTNEVIAGTELTDGDCTGTNVGKFSYSKNDIEPGRYNFRIYFKRADGRAVGTWGDIVVVVPGRTTSVTELALGEILLTAPIAPTGLSAYYVNNSAEGNFYNVLVTWTDASNNEEYFELTINDCDGTDPVLYKIFCNEKNTEAKKEIFWESSNYVAGTLSAGSNHCILKLPLGKKFDISMKAVNFIGSSDACSRLTTNTSAFTSDAFTVPDNTAYGAEKINLMSITYNLNGGLLKTSATTSKTGSLVDYKIYKDAAISLMEIKDAASDEYPKLEKNHHPFIGWKAAGAGAGDSAITEISDFGNTSVTASYNVLSIINYVIDDSYGTITATATAGSTEVKNGTLPNGNPSIRFEVTADTENPITHILVRFLDVDGNDTVVEADSNSVNFTETNALYTGTYTVQVIVTKADGKHYSDVFAITKSI